MRQISRKKKINIGTKNRPIEYISYHSEGKTHADELSYYCVEIYWFHYWCRITTFDYKKIKK